MKKSNIKVMQPSVNNTKGNHIYKSFYSCWASSIKWN